MKVTIVPIVIGALGTITKGLLKGLEDLEVGGRVERPESRDESWRLEETCCHSNSSEKPSANTDVKNSKGVNNNHINSEWSKLVQKENKTRQDWVEKVINWELCKKLKLDHTIKWYMHKLESLLDNETQNSQEF